MGEGKSFKGQFQNQGQDNEGKRNIGRRLLYHACRQVQMGEGNIMGKKKKNILNQGGGINPHHVLGKEHGMQM